MKIRIGLSLIFAFLLSFSVIAQVNAITEGLRTGNASAIAEYFDNSVWMCLETLEDEYGKQEASSLLNSFFELNKINGFKQLHEASKSKPGMEVIIGNLTTESKTFRVYVYLNKGAKSYIDELRIIVP